MKLIKVLKIYFKSNKIIKKLIRVKLIKKVIRMKIIEKKVIMYLYSKPIKSYTTKNIIDIEALDLSTVDFNYLKFASSMYKEHRFNILGSGWVSSDFNSEVLGFEGFFYDKIDKKISVSSFSNDYRKIDWHKDIKTGYRFNSYARAPKIYKNIPKGVDIKNPWELARMYHLPQMAIYGILQKDKRKELLTEFKNQIIDFTTANEIGYGVNYANPMEIAIRAVNLAISYDMFTQLDEENILDCQFKSNFSELLVKHGRVIISNLELNLYTQKNGNHYLANLCGLIFIASYIKNDETKEWLTFATEAMKEEIKKQFLKDGGFYECSTAYHRLSAELALYSIAMIIHENKTIDKKILMQLNDIIEFSTLTLKNDGNIIQIGDNDSGRLIKLSPKGKKLNIIDIEKYNLNLAEYNKLYKNEENIFVENELLSDTLMANCFALIDNKKFEKYAQHNLLEYSLIKSIIGNFKPIKYENKSLFIPSIMNNPINLSEMKFKVTTRICLKNLKLNDVKLKQAKEFGLHVFEANNFKLFVRSAVNYEKLRIGHGHDDILHYEISINKENYFSDSGSYAYTSIEEIRNSFRKADFHNVPIYKENRIDFNEVFTMKPKIKSKVVVQNNDKLGILIEFGEVRHYRLFTIFDTYILIEDFGSEVFQYNPDKMIYESTGYGIKTKRDFNLSYIEINITNSKDTNEKNKKQKEN